MRRDRPRRDPVADVVVTVASFAPAAERQVADRRTGWRPTPSSSRSTTRPTSRRRSPARPRCSSSTSASSSWPTATPGNFDGYPDPARRSARRSSPAPRPPARARPRDATSASGWPTSSSATRSSRRATELRPRHRPAALTAVRAAAGRRIGARGPRAGTLRRVGGRPPERGSSVRSSRRLVKRLLWSSSSSWSSSSPRPARWSAS